MSQDPTSLERLHDIIVPMPAPWWPPAPGWLWLLGAMGVVALVLSIRGIVRRQQNRYRREALAELARLASAATQEGPSAGIAEALAALLKRTALTVYPRELVAALTGADWFEFLDRTGGTRFAHGLGAALEQSIYHAGATALDRETLDALIHEGRVWIRHHRLAAPQAMAGISARAVRVPADAGAQRAA